MKERTALKINEAEIATMVCRFGCAPTTDPVVGIYHMPEGCWCYPDPVQALCAHHFNTAQSTGRIIDILRRDVA